MSGKITIKRIAKECNVSPVTVSRVIAGSSTVSEKTRSKVLSMMQELGYRDNKVTPQQRTQDLPIIAMMIEDVTRSSSSILHYAAQYLKMQGYLPLICETGERAADMRSYIENLSEYGIVKGIIVISSQGTRQELVEISNDFEDLPIVAVHWCQAWSKIDSVILDSYYNAYNAVEYLAELGHKCIALCNAPSQYSGSLEETRGYLDALAKNGFEKTEKYIFPAVFKADDGTKIAQELIKNMPEVTAVLSCNAVLARSLINELQVMGKRVPEDISVVAFDMITPTQTTGGITSIGPYSSDAGFAAARTLLEQINSKNDSFVQYRSLKKVVLESHFYTGATVRQLK